MRCQAVLVAVAFAVSRTYALPTAQDVKVLSLEHVPIVPLDPVLVNGDLSKRRESLELRNRVKLEWGNEDASATLEADFGGEDEHVINMDDFADVLENVDCTRPRLVLDFTDRKSLGDAIKQWDWVNERDSRHFIMVVNHPTCGKGNDRAPYRVHNVRYDRGKHVAYLDAREVDFKDVIHDGHLRIETVGTEAAPVEVPNVGELVKRSKNSTRRWDDPYSNVNVTRRWENTTAPAALARRAPFQNSTRRWNAPFLNTTRRSPVPSRNITKRWDVAPYANTTRRWENVTRRWEETPSAPPTLHRRTKVSKSISLDKEFNDPIFHKDAASLTCTSCSTTGKVKVALDVSIRLLSVTEAYLEFTTADLSAKMGLELEGSLEGKYVDSKELWRVNPVAVEIPGVAQLSFGPAFGVDWGVELHGDGKVGWGAGVDVEDGRARVCLKGCESSSEGLSIKTTKPPTTAAGSLSTSLTLHPSLTLSAAASLFSTTYHAGLALQAPSFAASFDTQSDPDGGVCGAREFKFGVRADASVGAGVYGFVGADHARAEEAVAIRIWEDVEDYGGCTGIRRRELDG